GESGFPLSCPPPAGRARLDSRLVESIGKQPSGEVLRADGSGTPSNGRTKRKLAASVHRGCAHRGSLTMNLINRLRNAFRFLVRRESVERELEAELRYHFDRQVEQNISRGMNRQEAERRAAIHVGNLEPLKDDCRDARLGRLVETVA